MARSTRQNTQSSHRINYNNCVALTEPQAGFKMQSPFSDIKVCHLVCPRSSLTHPPSSPVQHKTPFPEPCDASEHTLGRGGEQGSHHNIIGRKQTGEKSHGGTSAHLNCWTQVRRLSALLKGMSVVRVIKGIWNSFLFPLSHFDFPI